MNIKMLVAAHKLYQMPSDKSTYLPVFVGAVLHDYLPKGYQSDAEGTNISEKNPKYNELTAVYWAWKNLTSDAIGLVHYRRYFRDDHVPTGSKIGQILPRAEIEKKLQTHDVILPKKRHYYIETIESHYLHSHDAQGMKVLKQVMQTLPDNYQQAFEKVMNARSAHMFNMFIMKRSIFDAYCSWLFPVLEEIEGKIDFKLLKGNETRVIGFLSEFLLDVWLDANHIDYGEQPVVFLENEHWMKKAKIFLVNKYRGNSKFINTHIE